VLLSVIFCLDFDPFFTSLVPLLGDLPTFISLFIYPSWRLHLTQEMLNLGQGEALI
jgi:hypothetical protein